MSVGNSKLRMFGVSFSNAASRFFEYFGVEVAAKVNGNLYSSGVVIPFSF
jgi:hypothetical protein